MPPKKVVQETKLQLGRPGNNLKIGVVGLPNVGKSTFFNAITNSAAPAENFPFCTIDPEESRVAVPDERLTWMTANMKPNTTIPAYLTVIDIAGLVKGAAGGAGLGNAFLSHVRAVDAIFHVCRAFSEPDVVHVEGELDPIRDLEIIHEELRLKDEEFLSKHIELVKKALKSTTDKAKKEELEITEKVLKLLKEDKMDVRRVNWTNKEVEIINTLQLLTAKPVIYLANCSEPDYIRKKNKWLPKIKAWIDNNNKGDILIPFCASLELELSLLSDADKEARLKELGTTSAFPKIIVSGYNALNLCYYFTYGPKEVRAWTLRKNSKAPQAAGVIHSDFERGFIMAEVMKYQDLHDLGSEAAVKAAGKYLQKGKDYIVEDGDVIFFKFNVSNNPPAKNKK